MTVGLGEEPDTETSVCRVIDSGCDNRSLVHEHFQYIVIKESMDFKRFLDLFLIIQVSEQSVWSRFLPMIDFLANWGSVNGECLTTRVPSKRCTMLEI